MSDMLQVRSLQAEVLEAQKALKSLHADKQQSEAALQVSQVVLESITRAHCAVAFRQQLLFLRSDSVCGSVTMILNVARACA
jgi:hypothetical protein